MNKRQKNRQISLSDHWFARRMSAPAQKRRKNIARLKMIGIMLWLRDIFVIVVWISEKSRRKRVATIIIIIWKYLMNWAVGCECRTKYHMNENGSCRRSPTISCSMHLCHRADGKRSEWNALKINWPFKIVTHIRNEINESKILLFFYGWSYIKSLLLSH